MGLSLWWGWGGGGGKQEKRGFYGAGWGDRRGCEWVVNRWYDMVFFGVFVWVLVGWLCFSPVASRVSPRRASYFFLLRQKKVTKKKASHVRAASRCLALLAAFGTLANSLRSNSASVLIRTLLRCSARPNGGGIPLGSSASRTSPERLVRCAHLAGLGLPHSSTLTSFMGTARRAPTPSPLIPHSSLLTPHSSLLTPQFSPHSPKPA